MKTKSILLIILNVLLILFMMTNANIIETRKNDTVIDYIQSTDEQKIELLNYYKKTNKSIYKKLLKINSIN